MMWGCCSGWSAWTRRRFVNLVSYIGMGRTQHSSKTHQQDMAMKHFTHTNAASTTLATLGRQRPHLHSWLRSHLVILSTPPWPAWGVWRSCRALSSVASHTAGHPQAHRTSGRTCTPKTRCAGLGKRHSPNQPWRTRYVAPNHELGSSLLG